MKNDAAEMPFGIPITHRKLVFRSGAEGSAHDPYGWSERVVLENGCRYVLRQGALGYSRLYVNERLVCQCFPERRLGGGKTADIAGRWWQELTGIDPDKFDRYWNRINPPMDFDPDACIYGGP